MLYHPNHVRLQGLRASSPIVVKSHALQLYCSRLASNSPPKALNLDKCGIPPPFPTKPPSSAIQSKISPMCGQSLAHNLSTHVFSHNCPTIVKHLSHPTCELPHPCHLPPIQAIMWLLWPQRGCYHVTKIAHMHQCNHDVKRKTLYLPKRPSSANLTFSFPKIWLHLINEKNHVGWGFKSFGTGGSLIWLGQGWLEV